MKSVINLVNKELLQLSRDPFRLRIILVAPVIQLILLGYAANLDVRLIPMVVFDADQSQESRALVDRFVSSGYFVLERYVGRDADMDGVLARGDAAFGLVIPHGFSARVSAGREVALQGIADGSDAAFAARSVNYAAMIVREYSSNVLMVRAGAAGMQPPEAGVDAHVRVWFNPELDSKWFLVPGILALVIMIIALVGTALGLVREKELGTLEQLIVTPIRPYQLILGKLIPNAMVGIVVLLIVLATIRLIFGIPLVGSGPLLLLLSIVFLLTMQGLGLFVSTVSRTQQQAMMSAIFFIMLPMLLLSGFVFPIENMPAPIQAVTYLIPLRYYFNILRGIMLKGVGMEVLWGDALALTVFVFLSLGLSVWRLSKRLG